MTSLEDILSQLQPLLGPGGQQLEAEDYEVEGVTSALLAKLEAFCFKTV
jgi:hypothetical protein